MEDTSKIKERIISILKFKGPNFPSPIASEISTSILFTSAFLSELLSEKKLKITKMKVGSSPIYYISGQEEKLENFAIKYLKSKEKDAFILLKEKKILKDKEQHPAIRVALRQINDFAIPEEKNSELYWKYFLAPKEEIKIPEEKIENKINENNFEKENQKNIQNESAEKKPLEIFDETSKEKKEILKTKKKIIKKKSPAKKTSSTTNEKFFNKVKEFLSENNTEISDIISFSKNDLILKVNKNSDEYLLVSYNKKTIKEDDILKAYKKAQELNLQYEILFFGEPSKRITNIIEASKNLKEIKKIN